MRRSQEMRLTARSMAEAAIRLAEPETFATEHVVTLSQAIRREVASMGDGIERALARASELEAMVRSEVASLERTYGENERRIRVLLNELSSERESIVVNADRVSSALTSAQSALTGELEAATSTLTELLDQTGERIATALETRGNEVQNAFAQSSESLMAELESRAHRPAGEIPASWRRNHRGHRRARDRRPTPRCASLPKTSSPASMTRPAISPRS